MEVTPYDGSINGTSLNASKSISNTIPDFISAFLSPNGTVYRNTTFNAAFNVTDDDTGDQLNITIKWFTNNNYNSTDSRLYLSRDL